MINTKEIRFRTSEEMYAKIEMEYTEKRISRTEYMNSILGKYFAEKGNNLSLFLAQFQKRDKAIEKLELRIDGLTRMLIYFVQTFFFVHPEANENYIESMAYVEAEKQNENWFKSIWQNFHKKNPDFTKKVLEVFLDEEEGND